MGRRTHGNKEFGERLRQMRLARGLSIEHAAHQIGVSFSALQAWETGKAMPKSQQLEKIARFYQTHTDYLLFGEEAETPEQQVRRFLRRQGLEEDEIETVLTFLEAKKLRRRGRERG